VISNHAGEAITALTFVYSESPYQPLATKAQLPVAKGTTSLVIISLPDATRCVINADYAFESGKSTHQPGIDVCQLDSIVVE
jgi:hypothetical protein